MRAFAITGIGAAPSVLDAPSPSPRDGEVRVTVKAASVNGFDVAVAAGQVWESMPHTFPVILGRDFVGTVDGDRVAGVIMAPGLGPGAIAEYVTAQASSLTRIPDSVSDTDAAAMGLAGIAALDAVEALEVTGDDTVLVSGATGGVGSLAVQIAAARGATVIATARPGEEEDFVRALGAQHVVDYTGDLAAAVRDVSPDGVGKALHAAGDAIALAAVLVPDGRLASLRGVTSDDVGRADITTTAVVAHSTPQKLATLFDHVADSRLQPRVTMTLPLAAATEALAAFRSGTLGKILITC